MDESAYWNSGNSDYKFFLDLGTMHRWIVDKIQVYCYNHNIECSVFGVRNGLFVKRFYFSLKQVKPSELKELRNYLAEIKNKIAPVV